MKKACLLLVMGIGIAVLGSAEVHGQSDITFQVDITHLLDANEFNPDKDRVELIGNKHPLSATAPLKMKRDENETALFKVTVSFPISMENRQLEYQFRVMIDNRYSNEDIPRSLRISDSDQTLDALYFNSYAW